MDTTDEKDSDKLDDIYEDFADFDLGKTVDKLQNENKELKDHIYSQEINIKKLAEALEEMQKVNESLTNNISSLYRTAKSELERKDCIIVDLRNQVDNITFRRTGGQINTNINRGLNIVKKEASFVKSEVEITNISREDYVTKVDTISDKCDVQMVDDHLINRKELFTASNCEQNIKNKYKESETRDHHKNNTENRYNMFQHRYNNNKESTFKNHNAQLETSLFEENSRKYNKKSRHPNEFNVRDLRYRIPKKSYNRGDHSDYRFDRRYEENKGHCSRQDKKMENKSHSYHDRDGLRNDTYKRREDKLQDNKRSEVKKILKVVDKMENKILTKSRISPLESPKERLEKSKKKLEKNKEKLEANKDKRSEEIVLKQTSQPVKNFFTDQLDHILNSIQNNINDKAEPQKYENVSQEEKSLSKKKNHRRSKDKLYHLFEEELEHSKVDDNFIEILEKPALKKNDRGDKKEGKHHQNNKFEKDIGLLENYIEISSIEDDGFFDDNLRREIEPTKKRKKKDFDCSLEENKLKKTKHSNLNEDLILDADEIKTKKKRKSNEKVTKEDLNSIFGDDSISNNEKIKTNKKQKSKENCKKKDLISLLFSDDSTSNNKSEKATENLSSLVFCNDSNEKINTKEKRKSKENKVISNDNVVSESVNDTELGPSLKNCPITPDECIKDVIKRDGEKKTKKRPKSETFLVEPNLEVSEDSVTSDKHVKSKIKPKSILIETISNCLEVLENQAFAKQTIDKVQISSENNKNQSTNGAENNRDNLEKEKMVVEDKDKGQLTKKSQKIKKDGSCEKNSTFAVAQKETDYTRCSITPVDEDIVSSKHNCLEILKKTADMSSFVEKNIDKDQVPSEDNKKRNKNGAENNQDNSEKEQNRSPKEDFNLEDNKDKDEKPSTKKSQRIKKDDSCEKNSTIKKDGSCEKNSTFAVAQKKTDYTRCSITPVDEDIVSSKHNCLEILKKTADMSSFVEKNIDKDQVPSEDNKKRNKNGAENNQDNSEKEQNRSPKEDFNLEDNKDKDEKPSTKKSQRIKKDDSCEKNSTIKKDGSCEKNSTFAVAQKKTDYTRCSITPVDEDIVSSKHNCLEILKKTADMSSFVEKNIDKDQVPSEDNKKGNKNGAENNRENSEKEKNRSPKKDFNLEDNKDKDEKPSTKKSQRIKKDDSCEKNSTIKKDGSCEKNSTFAVAQKKTDYTRCSITPLDENIVSSNITPIDKETTKRKSEKNKSVLQDSCEEVEAIKKIPKKRKSPRITSSTKFSPNNRKCNMNDKQKLEDTTEIETIGKKSSILREPLKEKEDSPCELTVKPDNKIVIVSDILLQSGTPKRQKTENKSLKEGTQNTLRIQIDFTDLENITKESNFKSEAGIIEDVSKVDLSDIDRKLTTTKSVSRKDILLERYASDESQNKLNKCREILNKNKNENLSNESNKIEAKNLNKSDAFSEKNPKINPLKKRRVDFKLTDTEAENNKEEQIENIEQTLKLMHKMERDNIEETKQMLGSNSSEKKDKSENKKEENNSATNERTLRRGRSRSTSDKAAINNKTDYEAVGKTKNPREIKQRISETDKNKDKTSEAITKTNKLARKSTEDAKDGSSKIMKAIDDTYITDHKNKLKKDDTQTITENRKEELTSLSDRKSASEVKSNTTEQYNTNINIQQHLDLSTNSAEREKNDKPAEEIKINIPDQKPQENSLVKQKKTHQLPPCLGNVPVNSSNSQIGQLSKTRKRITPTPVKDSPVCSFKNILERNNLEFKIFSKNFTMDSTLNLTDEGEIPILHLEENHFNNMEDATQKTFDRSIMKLLDCMNVSNLDCDISKLNDKVENSAPNESLTFENVIDKASSAVIDVTSNNEEGKVVDIKRNRTPVENQMQTKMLTSTPRVDANVVINDTTVTNNQNMTDVKTVNTSKPSLNVTNARANGVSTSVNVADRSVNGSHASVSEPVRFRRRCRMIAVRKM